MDVQWSMIWTSANAVAAKSRKQRNAFADPLEGDEWTGLAWSVPVVSRLVAGSRGAAQESQKIKEVERFTDAASAKAVCVS